MTTAIKNFFSLILRIGLSGFLLWWIFRKIDLVQVKDAIQGARGIDLWIAGLFFFLATMAILSRWFIFVRALGLKFHWASLTYWFFIGLCCNLFLPTGVGGDIVKIIGVCREASDKPKVVASVVLDRLSGFAGIVVTAIVAFLFGHSLIQSKSVGISIVLMAVLSLAIACILFSSRVHKVTNILFAFAPKIKEKIETIQKDFLLMRNKTTEGLQAIGMSCLAQVLLAVSFYFIAKGLHQDIHIGYFLVFSPLVCVTSTVPSIGGLGVREAGWAYLFSCVGFPQHVGVSMSLINFLMMVAVGMIGGILYVSSLFTRRVQHPSKDTGTKFQKA